MASKLMKYAGEDENYGKVDFFYSPDMKKDIGLKDDFALDILSWTTLNKFLGMNFEYEKVIEANAKKNNLENIAILAAHGADKDGKWFYFVDEKEKSMQRWINSVDGKYKLIILYSCNPGGNEVYTKKTPIIAPNETFSYKLYNEGKVQVELIMPNTGYVDSYMIEEELKKIEEK